MKSKIQKIPRYLEQIFLFDFDKKKEFSNYLVLFSHSERKEVFKKYKENFSSSEQNKLLDNEKTQISLIDKKNNHWVFVTSPKLNQTSSHQGLLEESNFTLWKNIGGYIIDYFSKKDESIPVQVEILINDELSLLGFFLGIELKCYEFLSIYTDHARKYRTSYLPIFYCLSSEKTVKKNFKEAQNWGFGQNLARHLVNLPAKDCYPEIIVNHIIFYFKKLKYVEIHILNQEQMKKEKMGLALGVGQSGKHPPYFVYLKYHPPQSHKLDKNFALVGKGVTFDSGGLNIKSSQAMRLMKKDMAGAAAVIGSLYYIAAQELPVSVSGFMALAENAIDANATHPGDILKSRREILVEIHDTDAEGRLLLADSIDFALNYQSDVIIDLATLTGSIKYTLGLEIAGLFSNHDELCDQLLKASQLSGDLSWRIPLYSKYSHQFSTPFADLVNCVDGWGGAITAALFLERFVQKKPWAHFDFFGWSEKPAPFECHSGANGQGIGILNMFFRQKAQNKL